MTDVYAILDSAENGPLPNRPSSLVFRAMADLRECIEDANYEPDSTRCHVPSEDGAYVSVDLAGSVMAKTLRANPFRRAYKRNYNAQEKRKLFALMKLQFGGLLDALEDLIPQYGFTCRPRKNLDRQFTQLAYRLLPINSSALLGDLEEIFHRHDPAPGPDIKHPRPGDYQGANCAKNFLPILHAIAERLRAAGH